MIPGDPLPNTSLPLRLAVGLGEPERERQLLLRLAEPGDVVVIARCLAAEELLEVARSGRPDAILAAFDLHRLNRAQLEELPRTGVPLVLLVPEPSDARWRGLEAALLPLVADPATLRGALAAVVRGERPAPPEPVEVLEPAPVQLEPATGARDATGDGSTVLVVASGYGSPGRTTVALNLATALGAVAPTVLVEADLAGPSLAACLDADPTRNLAMLAHAEPATPRDWDRCLEQELQPLAERSPRGALLCGVPKPELRPGVSIDFFERLMAELRARYRYVIVDSGADLLGVELGLHRAAVRLADHVLLVAAADLVGLWHAHTALRRLATGPLPTGDGPALVINRHDRRHHHGRAEIEWALSRPAAAVIPHDYRAVQWSLSTQRPLVLEGRGRAASALLELAERVHGGRILLPPEQTDEGRAARLRRLMRRLRERLHRAPITPDGPGERLHDAERAAVP